MFHGLTQAVFGVVNIVMKFAPIGAFGAMAFTVGRYGIKSLGPLAKFIGTFWLTSALFIIIVMGAIAWAAGFNIFRFLALHQGRDYPGTGNQLLRNCLADAHGKDGAAGMLQATGRFGRADRVHLQHRRQQYVHDHGRALCRAGHQHPPDSDPTANHLRGSRAYVQRSAPASKAPPS